MRNPLKLRQISIHALCEEGDPSQSRRLPRRRYFYPRPLRGGRPPTVSLDHRLEAISIHALCEEGDYSFAICLSSFAYFYPRPLRGGRRCQPRPGSRPDQFLSTPSARRATDVLLRAAAHSSISIHALCEEGDRDMRRGSPGLRNFYPRPLRGGRPCDMSVGEQAIKISIHALCEEGDFMRISLGGQSRKFLSTPSARRATRL